MASLLERIALCTERGKVNRDAPYPPDLKGEDGADELTAQALAEGIDPNDLLQEGLMTGMSRIGEKFGKGEAFVPDLLMAARAMNAGMAHLKPTSVGVTPQGHLRDRHRAGRSSRHRQEPRRRDRQGLAGKSSIWASTSTPRDSGRDPTPARGRPERPPHHHHGKYGGHRPPSRKNTPKPKCWSAGLP